MAHIPRHGAGNAARMESLQRGGAPTKTGASPVFVDGSGRRSRRFRGATAVALMVLMLFLVFAVGIVHSYFNSSVRWQQGPGARTVRMAP